MVEEITCPKCGSLETRKYGLRILAGGKKAQTYQCKVCGSYFRSKKLATSEPYHYGRFRWWRDIDLQQVSEELGTQFKVEMHIAPSDEQEISIYRDDRDELQVKADTLTALLSSFRAVLFQKEAGPFTPKDMMLRAKVFELYPRSRPTPFPMQLPHEPSFEVAKT